MFRSVALRLAQAGAKVAVLERGIPGAEASSAAAGILSPGVEAVEPGPFHALCRASLERYPSFVREVEALSGMSVGFRALGTLEVALDDTHAKVLAGRAEKMLRHGLPVEVEVEKALGITNKHEIEDFGIEAFNQRCRESVQRYVEDCQICCQPIEFSLEVDHAGVLQSLSTLRSD